MRAVRIDQQRVCAGAREICPHRSTDRAGTPNRYVVHACFFNVLIA